MSRFRRLAVFFSGLGLLVFTGACGTDSSPSTGTSPSSRPSVTTPKTLEASKPTGKLGRENKIKACIHPDSDELYALAGQHVVTVEETTGEEWNSCKALNKPGVMQLTTRVDTPGSSALYDLFKDQLRSEGSTNQSLNANQLPRTINMAYWQTDRSGKVIGLVFHSTHGVTYSATFQSPTKPQLLNYMRRMAPIADGIFKELYKS